MVLVPSNSFECRRDLPPPCARRKEIVGGGNFPSRILGTGTESLERRLVDGIGINNCGSGSNDGASLLVASLSGRILMWSLGGHPWKWKGVHPCKLWGVHPHKR